MQIDLDLPLIRVALALAAASLLPACASKATTEPTPSDDPLVLRSTIGPEGGSLKGDEGTVFEGVELVLPEGALSGEADVTIRPVFDGKPLPELAERVGQHFSIVSSEPFQKTASLTLPVGDDLVDALGQTGKDVKVWVRDADAWSLSEATSTAAGSVTIDLAAPATAAAGVKIVPQPGNCQSGLPTGIVCTSTAASLLAPATCPAAGLCLTLIREKFGPIEGFLFDVTADGKTLVTLSPTSQGVVSAGLDVTSGKLTKGASLDLLSGARRSLAIDSSGTIAFGLGFQGNASLPASGTGKLTDAGRSGLGAVRLGDGRVVAASFDAGKGAISISTSSNVAVLQVDHAIDGQRVALATDPTQASDFVLASGDHVVTLRVDKAGKVSVVDDIPLPQTGPVMVAVAKAKDGTLAGIFSPRDPQSIVSRTVMTRPPGGTLAPLAPLADFSSAGQLGFDASGTLFVSSATRPVLFVVPAMGAAKAFSLSDADGASPEAAGKIVRGFRPSPMTGAVFVVTEDGSFLSAVTSSP